MHTKAKDLTIYGFKKIAIAALLKVGERNMSVCDPRNCSQFQKSENEKGITTVRKS